MLSRFTVGNFKSFNKKQTLSLIASTIQNNKDRLFKTEDFKILKFASIFGANASGKSNFINAMDFAQAIVFKGTDFNSFDTCKNDYFRLNPLNKDTPSYFEFEIIIDEIAYAYGFEMLIFQKKITEEWLIKLGKNKDEEIFTRNTVTKQFYFNHSYLTEDYEKRMAVYVEDYITETNKMFLTDLLTKKNDLFETNKQLSILRDVASWLRGVNISYPETIITGYDCFTQKNTTEILNILKSFKTGISRIIKREISKEQALEKLTSDYQEKIEKDLHENCPPDCEEDCHNCGFRFNNNGRLIFVTYKNKEPIFEEVSFEHFGVDNVMFSLRDESEGTRRLLDLLSVLFTQKENSVFVIDEIDRSLHPQLTIQFVKTFLEIARKRNIQLIITTHESHLLDLSMLRQDEIFFVKAIRTGESVLYPFDRFKERFDKKIEKPYLDGRYGAVPIFDSIYVPFSNETE